MGGSLPPEAISDLDVLEEIGLKSSPQDKSPMEVEEIPTIMTETTQAPPESKIILPLLALNVSPFEVLIDTPLKQVGSLVFPFLFVHCLTHTLVGSLLDTRDVTNRVYDIKETFRCLNTLMYTSEHV